MVHFRSLPEGLTGMANKMKTTCILETSIYRGDRENVSHNKEYFGKNMSGNTFVMGSGTIHYFALDEGSTQKWT